MATKQLSILKACEDNNIEGLKEVVVSHLRGDLFHLSHFLGVHDFVFDSATPTASIGKKRICRINPGFVKEHANTPQKLVMLICHEVYHKILGHIEVPRGYAENVAMDATINTMLCLVFRGAKYWAFLKDYYSDTEFPSFILRPGSRIKSMKFIDRRYYNVLYHKKNLCGSGLEAHHLGKKHSGHNDRSWGLTWKDVLDWITKDGDKFKDSTEGCKAGAGGIPLPGGGILIGDHTLGKPTDGESGDLEKIEKIVKEASDQVSSGGTSAGWGGTLFDELLEELHVRKNKKLAAAFEKALMQTPISNMVSTIRSRFPALPDRTVIPLGVGRREILMLAEGYTPVFWTTKIPDINKGSVHVYIDTSGSMGEWVKWCYELCVGLSDWLAEPVHLFSNQIADISVSKLRQGFVKSTGGTDFDCIVSHMVKNNIKRTVIITDGYADLKKKNQKILKSQERSVFTAFIPGSGDSYLYSRVKEVTKGKPHGVLKKVSDQCFGLSEEDKIE